MPKLQPATFTITHQQLKWLEAFSEKTGLHKVEIVRRALDAYAEAEETKERRDLFTPQQRQDIRETARSQGISEREVIQSAINRELRFKEKLRQTRKER